MPRRKQQAPRRAAGTGAGPAPLRSSPPSGSPSASPPPRPRAGRRASHPAARLGAGRGTLGPRGGGEGGDVIGVDFTGVYLHSFDSRGGERKLCPYFGTHFSIAPTPGCGGSTLWGPGRCASTCSMHGPVCWGARRRVLGISSPHFSTTFASLPRSLRYALSPALTDK